MNEEPSDLPDPAGELQRHSLHLEIAALTFSYGVLVWFLINSLMGHGEDFSLITGSAMLVVGGIWLLVSPIALGVAAANHRALRRKLAATTFCRALSATRIRRLRAGANNSLGMAWFSAVFGPFAWWAFSRGAMVGRPAIDEITVVLIWITVFLTWLPATLVWLVTATASRATLLQHFTALGFPYPEKPAQK